MVNITYMGSNVVDWNTRLDKTELERLASVGQSNKNFRFNEDQIFLLKEAGSQIYLYLYKGEDYILDKNPAGKKQWEIKTKPSLGKQTTKEFPNCLRRPGGGPTNNVHTAGTLARSLGFNNSLELLVLQESQFTRDLFKKELEGAGFCYDFIRPSQQEIDNVSFACDGKKTTYTSAESSFENKLTSRLENKLNVRVQKPQDVLVVNSVKDKGYLRAILDWYDKTQVKPVLIAAVTSSMLSKRGDGLDVNGLVNRCDIYVSNIEELYDLLNGTVYQNKTKWDELNNADLYNGMLNILKLQKANGKKGKVYVTCGDRGAVVMDSNGVMYFQGAPRSIQYPVENPPLDLNGAGDTFAGVMTLLEAEDKYNLLEILDYSIAASQICIKELGANRSNRITATSIRDFRCDYRDDIWKYEPRTNEFRRFASLWCNLE